MSWRDSNKNHISDNKYFCPLKKKKNHYNFFKSFFFSWLFCILKKTINSWSLICIFSVLILKTDSISLCKYEAINMQPIRTEDVFSYLGQRCAYCTWNDQKQNGFNKTCCIVVTDSWRKLWQHLSCYVSKLAHLLNKPVCESLWRSRVTPSAGPCVYVCVHITQSQIRAWHLGAIIAHQKAWGIN